MEDILKFNKQDKIDISDLRNSCLDRGIQFTEEELQELFNSLKFSVNESNEVSRLEVYANAHLFQLDASKRSDILNRIAIGCGVGINENDL
jgi:phenylalanyl-tRNA synthetase beta subunit